MTGALTRAGDAGGREHEKGVILLPGGFQKSWQHAIESQRSVTAMYQSQYAKFVLLDTTYVTFPQPSQICGHLHETSLHNTSLVMCVVSVPSSIVLADILPRYRRSGVT